MTNTPVDPNAPAPVGEVVDPKKPDSPAGDPSRAMFGNIQRKGDTVEPKKSVSAVTHTVAPGESLEYIARLYYAPDQVTPRTLKGLFSANTDRLRDPGSLTVGTNIVIPDYDPGWQDDLYWEVKESPAVQEYWRNRLAMPPSL